MPLLVTLDDWHAAQEGMKSRYKVRKARVTAEQDHYLLRGLLTCGHCGAALRSGSNGKTTHSQAIRYYLCPCHAPSRARVLGKPVCEPPDVPAAKRGGRK